MGASRDGAGKELVDGGHGIDARAHDVPFRSSGDRYGVMLIGALFLLLTGTAASIR
jgi:hypothetical protein